MEQKILFIVFVGPKFPFAGGQMEYTLNIQTKIQEKPKALLK